MTVGEYLRPQSLAEAIELLGRHGPELLVIAGGTVAMPLVNDGVSLPERVMGLRAAGLDRIEPADGHLRIGATATLSALLQRSELALLQAAARNTASWPIRNLGTVGGNLFTPPPGGDVAVALLALDARVRLAGSHGEREVPIAAFHTGFLTTDLGPDELVTELVVTLAPRDGAYLKLGRKHANTPAVVSVAVALDAADGQAGDAHGLDVVRGARIALGAVGPHPVRAHAAEAAIEGRPLDDASIAAAAAAATEDAQPFDDGIASAWYRRRMVGVVVRQALEQVAAERAADRDTTVAGRS
jgi:CO/xanthine dehydrogenase FAD-binding subunit